MIEKINLLLRLFNSKDIFGIMHWQPDEILYYRKWIASERKGYQIKNSLYFRVKLIKDKKLQVWFIKK